MDLGHFDEQNIHKLRLSLLKKIHLEKKVPDYYEENLDRIKWKLNKCCNSSSGKRNESFIIQVFNPTDAHIVKKTIDEALSSDIKNNNIIINLSGVVDTTVDTLLTQFENQVYRNIDINSLKSKKMDDDEDLVTLDKLFKDKMDRYFTYLETGESVNYTGLDHNIDFVSGENKTRAFDTFLSFLANDAQLVLNKANKFLIGRNQLPTVFFIVDSLELFSEDIERQTLLYNLFDFMDGNNDKYAFSTCFVGVTTLPYIENMLEKRVHSRFSNTFITFKPLNDFDTFKDDFYRSLMFNFDEETCDYDSYITSGLETQWNSLVLKWENQHSFDDNWILNDFLRTLFYSNKNYHQLQMGLLNGLNYINFNMATWENIETKFPNAVVEYYMNTNRNGLSELVKSLTDLEILLLILITKKNKMLFANEDDRLTYKHNNKTTSLVQVYRLYEDLYTSKDSRDIPIRKFPKIVVKSCWERLIKLGLINHRTKMKSHVDLVRVFKTANSSRYTTLSNPTMERYSCLLTLDEIRKIITPKNKLFELTSI
ncbi:hypothetical protein ACO0R3_000305 [Hanseniaspora guilliermondii]